MQQGNSTKGSYCVPNQSFRGYRNNGLWPAILTLATFAAALADVRTECKTEWRHNRIAESCFETRLQGNISNAVDCPSQCRIIVALLCQMIMTNLEWVCVKHLANLLCNFLFFFIFPTLRPYFVCVYQMYACKHSNACALTVQNECGNTISLPFRTTSRKDLEQLSKKWLP